ncbi:glycosyltransferase [Kibdelosporangium lantanae]
MSRVLIVTTGTDGDIAPITGLGARFRRSGHDVAVATYDAYAARVRASGCEFRSLPGDPHALGVNEMGRPGARVAGDLVRASRWLTGILRHRADLEDGLVAAVEQGADVLLCGGLTMQHGYHLAKAFGIPSMGLALQPTHPTGDFPPPMGIPSLGRWANRSLGRLLQAAGTSPWSSSPEFCRRLGVPELDTAATFRQQAAERWPVHHGFSPTLLPRPTDWRPGLEVVGYWWPYQPDSWRPPARLVDFLAAGPPPVRVGLGSGGDRRDAERISSVVVAALRRAQVRGIVQSGWAGLSGSGDDVITVGDVPHSWLFPRMAAVVHHCGAGTTGAGLRAEVPAVGVPLFGDSLFWARRLVARGASPGFVRLNSISVDVLATLIRRAVDIRVPALGVADEDGVGRTAATVDRLLTGVTHPT